MSIWPSCASTGPTLSSRGSGLNTQQAIACHDAKHTYTYTQKHAVQIHTNTHEALRHRECRLQTVGVESDASAHNTDTYAAYTNCVFKDSQFLVSFHARFSSPALFLLFSIIVLLFCSILHASIITYCSALCHLHPCHNFSDFQLLLYTTQLALVTKSICRPS